MNNMKIKAIAESAMGAAVCALLMITSLYVPFFSGIAAIVSGIPIMCLFYKNNITSGILAFVCAFLITFILTGDIVSVGVMAFLYVAPAVVFGIFNSKGNKFSASVAAAAVVTLIGVVIEFSMLNGSGTGIRDFVTSYSNNIQSMLSETMAASGVDMGEDMSGAVTRVINQAIDMIMYYLPTIIICIAVFYAYLVAMVGAFVLKRLRIKEVQHTPFNTLVAPKYVCHITVILFVLTYIIKDSGVYSAALKNVLLVSEIFLGICGFAFLDLKFSKVLRQWYIRLIIYIGIWFSVFMLLPFLGEILVLVGFFRSLFQNNSHDSFGGEKYGD